MKNRIRSQYGLMLFELVIVIGFFAVFAAIFLRIFLSAHQLYVQSNNLSHAIVAAENAAECFKSGADPILFYDKDWNPTAEKDASYKLTLNVMSQEDINTANIIVKSKDGAEEFSLTVKKLKEMSS